MLLSEVCAPPLNRAVIKRLLQEGLPCPTILIKTHRRPGWGPAAVATSLSHELNESLKSVIHFSPFRIKHHPYVMLYVGHLWSTIHITTSQGPCFLELSFVLVLFGCQICIPPKNAERLDLTHTFIFSFVVEHFIRSVLYLAHLPLCMNSFVPEQCYANWNSKPAAHAQGAMLTALTAGLAETEALSGCFRSRWNVAWPPWGSRYFTQTRQQA